MEEELKKMNLISKVVRLTLDIDTVNKFYYGNEDRKLVELIENVIKEDKEYRKLKKELKEKFPEDKEETERLEKRYNEIKQKLNQSTKKA